MQPRVNVITLGVADLERSLAFYRDGLGLSTEGVIGTEFPGDERQPAGAVAMFPLDGGLTLALYPAAELAKDAGTDAVAGQEDRPAAFSLGHVVDSRAEVDAVLRQAATAGGRVLGEAHERPWGIYSGYFADPDGHLWEAVHFLTDGTPADG
jgi:uncharacterized protein